MNEFINVSFFINDIIRLYIYIYKVLKFKKFFILVFLQSFHCP